MLIFIKSRWWLLLLFVILFSEPFYMFDLSHNLTIILKGGEDLILNNEGKINDYKLSLRAFSNRG